MSEQIQTKNNNKTLIIVIITFAVLIGLCVLCLMCYGIFTAIRFNNMKSNISNSELIWTSTSIPCTAKNTETSKSTNVIFTGFVDSKDSNHCILLDQDGKTIIYGGTVGSK